ncbi:hypothetical protein L0222_13010 [bacterium]|nr:hypothetical protein [bacterium]MCI0605379.1 hypothetical protein [bacterium]
MNVERLSNTEVNQRKRSAYRLGSHCYIIKSSLGTFLAFTFLDALYLARQIFAIKGCWALIKV